MLNYTPQNQIDSLDFKTEFEGKLNPENRRVKMAKLIDWDAFAMIYGRNFTSNTGAKGIDVRIVIGALIIKHIEGKDNRGTIQAIQENPYMQFFLGLDYFSSAPVFDLSLFVHIRKRLSNEDFDKMNQATISKALNISEKNEKQAQKMTMMIPAIIAVARARDQNLNGRNQKKPKTKESYS